MTGYGSHVNVSVASHLTLRDRPDPTQQDIEAQMNAPNRPEGLGTVCPVTHEPEDDSKHDTAEVAYAAGEARHDAVGLGVHMRDQCKVGAVAGLEEDGHQRHEAREGGQVVRVDAADDDQQHARQDTACMHPRLLEPQAVPELVVQHVGDDTAQRPGDKVEEAKHGRPVGRLGLAQAGEVLVVVGRQGRVDCELAAERTGIAQHQDPRLRAEPNLHGLLERRLDDQFALRRLEHVIAGHVGIVAGVMARAAVALERGLV